MCAGLIRRSIVATVLAGAALMAGATTASGERGTRNPSTYHDPTGDSGTGPDISSVTLRNTAAGTIGFDISIPTWKQQILPADGVVALFIDADRDGATGSDGFEYTLQTSGGFSEAALGRWDSSAWRKVAAPSLVKILNVSTGTVTFQISRADLGNTGGFHAWVATASSMTDEEWADLAPDGDATYDYFLSTPRVTRAAVHSLPSTPRAGRQFTVGGVTFTFATHDKLTARSLRCRATLGRKALRGSGPGGCTFSLPRNAKGKRLAVAITAAVTGDSLMVRKSFTVR